MLCVCTYPLQCGLLVNCLIQNFLTPCNYCTRVTLTSNGNSYCTDLQLLHFLLVEIKHSHCFNMISHNILRAGQSFEIFPISTTVCSIMKFSMIKFSHRIFFPMCAAAIEQSCVSTNARMSTLNAVSS